MMVKETCSETLKLLNHICKGYLSQRNWLILLEIRESSSNRLGDATMKTKGYGLEL